jgi:serine/threonine protein kinase
LQFDSSKYPSLQAALADRQALAKVADFGLSRKIPHDKSHTSNIKQGTPFFVAPEVSKQHRLHKTSDVYSYGVIMWELMRGCPVFADSRCAPFSPAFFGFIDSKTNLKKFELVSSASIAFIMGLCDKLQSPRNTPDANV